MRAFYCSRAFIMSSTIPYKTFDRRDPDFPFGSDPFRGLPGNPPFGEKSLQQDEILRILSDGKETHARNLYDASPHRIVYLQDPETRKGLQVLFRSSGKSVHRYQAEAQLLAYEISQWFGQRVGHYLVPPVALRSIHNSRSISSYGSCHYYLGPGNEMLPSSLPAEQKALAASFLYVIGQWNTHAGNYRITERTESYETGEKPLEMKFRSVLLIDNKNMADLQKETPEYGAMPEIHLSLPEQISFPLDQPNGKMEPVTPKDFNTFEDMARKRDIGYERSGKLYTTLFEKYPFPNLVFSSDRALYVQINKRNFFPNSPIFPLDTDQLPETAIRAWKSLTADVIRSLCRSFFMHLQEQFDDRSWEERLVKGISERKDRMLAKIRPMESSKKES